MFERFTDRSRRVMQLANVEAKRLSHERVDSEHLLIGLVKEGAGVAAHVLKNLDIELRKVRLEVEKLLHFDQEVDYVIMGRLPLSPSVIGIITFAKEEADKLGHTYVGTEHLLLGMLRSQDSGAAHVLKSLGLSLDVVRDEVMMFLGAKMAPGDGVSPAKQDCRSETAEKWRSVNLLELQAAFEKVAAMVTTHDPSLRVGAAAALLADELRKNPAGAAAWFDEIRGVLAQGRLVSDEENRFDQIARDLMMKLFEIDIPIGANKLVAVKVGMEIWGESLVEVQPSEAFKNAVMSGWVSDKWSWDHDMWGAAKMNVAPENDEMDKWRESLVDLQKIIIHEPSEELKKAVLMNGWNMDELVGAKMNVISENLGKAAAAADPSGHMRLSDAAQQLQADQMAAVAADFYSEPYAAMLQKGVVSEFALPVEKDNDGAGDGPRSVNGLGFVVGPVVGNMAAVNRIQLDDDDEFIPVERDSNGMAILTPEMEEALKMFDEAVAASDEDEDQPIVVGPG